VRPYIGFGNRAGTRACPYIKIRGKRGGRALILILPFEVLDAMAEVVMLLPGLIVE